LVYEQLAGQVAVRVRPVEGLRRGPDGCTRTLYLPFLRPPQDVNCNVDQYVYANVNLSGRLRSVDERNLRVLKATEPPLGLYLRPGRNDHQKLLDLIAEGGLACSGFVLDPALNERQRELREEAAQLSFETVLDPRVAELATEGGFATAPRDRLPWAPEKAHSIGDLRETGGTALAEALAEFACDEGYNAVLAPAHLLAGADDGWLDVDANLVRSLRFRLDALQLPEVPIYYPLIVTTTTLKNPDERGRLVLRLARLPIDAVWLRVTPFGATSGPLALKRYIEAAKEFQQVGVPVVAERTGTAGLPLLAFGAVGGIEGGITLGERFDAAMWTRPPKDDGKGFSPAPRVYVAKLGVYMSQAQANRFFENRQMKALFGCKDGCCRRGTTDMLADPRRHFVKQRTSEVARLSRAPVQLRPNLYMDDFLRGATDLALQAAKVDPGLVANQRRLERWRIGLSGLIRDGVDIPADVAVPSGRRIIRSIGA
jgi:hypothetical protein